MRRRRREESEGVREDEDDGVTRREGEGRSRGSVKSAQTSDAFRIRWSIPSLSVRSLLVAVMLMMMMGGVEGLRCQCSRSTEAAHCSQQLCDIKPREGKVPACVFVRDGPLQHYACIRVEEDDDMGCRVMRGRAGGHKVACMCKDADMCNVDMSDRVDDGGADRRILKVPAELIGEPSVVRVRAEQTREGRDHDVLLEPDRDDSLGVAPSVVDFFDEESEIGVGRGGKGGGGSNHRERETWSDEEEKRFPSSSYRLVHGVDNGQLVPLTVKRLGEEKRSKLEDNVIDLTKPGYRRPAPVPSPARPPLYPSVTRRPDWRQPGTQPVPRGPFDPVRREEERKRIEEGEQRVHRVEWTPRSRPYPPPPPTTTTPAPPPPPPPRSPTPFTIGRINTFVERPSPDPFPYPKRWDDRPNPPPTTTTTVTASTTTTTEATTTTPATRRTYSVSVSRYVVTTSTTTVPPSTTESTTTTTEPTTTTTVPTTTTTIPTTTTETPTTTTLSTVAPSTTTLDYDDMDGEEEEKDYDHVVLASGTKTNTVPQVAEKEPDSGTINTIWTTVVVTVVLISAMY